MTDRRLVVLAALAGIAGYALVSGTRDFLVWHAQVAGIGQRPAGTVATPLANIDSREAARRAKELFGIDFDEPGF